MRVFLQTLSKVKRKYLSNCFGNFNKYFKNCNPKKNKPNTSTASIFIHTAIGALVTLTGDPVASKGQ